MNALPRQQWRYTPVRPPTATGTEESVVVPLPRSPKELSPQQLTDPVVSNAQVWVSPAETEVTPARPLTTVGTEELMVVPLPNSPSPLYPQHLTIFVLSSAQLLIEPRAETAVTPVRPLTATGTEESNLAPLLPFPS